MIIGHQDQWNFLLNFFEHKAIPQAMVFSGPESIGKKKIAVEFAKLVNCQERQSKLPCGQCYHCRLIEENRHPDVHLVMPEKGSMKIEEAREIIRMLSLKPQLSQYKIFIIDQADTLSSDSQSTLLKTLEEPIGNAVIILITSKPMELVDTIRSRCQIVKFYPVPFKTIESALGNKISPEELKQMFILSGNRIGRMMNFITDPQQFSSALQRYYKVEELMSMDIANKFAFAKRFFEGEVNRQKTVEFLEDIENYLRLLLLKDIGVGEEFIGPIPLKAFAYSSKELSDSIKSTGNIKLLMEKTNIDPRLAIENLFITLTL